MDPLSTKKDYQNYVDQKSPNSPIWKNCFNAFWVGGLICTIGQLIWEACKMQGLNTQASTTIVSIILIFLLMKLYLGTKQENNQMSLVRKK